MTSIKNASLPINDPGQTYVCETNGTLNDPYEGELFTFVSFMITVMFRTCVPATEQVGLRSVAGPLRELDICREGRNVGSQETSAGSCQLHTGQYNRT